MKILIITGKQAYPIIKKNTEKYNFIDVHKVNISIAAFLTPNRIIKEIKTIEKNKNIKLSNVYDFILVTGLIRHDLSKIYNETNIKCYKSTREATDIPLLIENLDKIKLSSKNYADEQISKYIKEKAEKELEKGELKKLSKYDIKIGNLKVGDSYPMRVLGEIVHTPWLSNEELEKKVNYYIDSGADMIDLGMISGENNTDDLKRIINIVRDLTDKPISIDTLNTKELIKGIELNVDMILSVDGGNINELLPYLKERDVAVVCLPTNYKKNYVPETIKDKIVNLENYTNILKDNNIKVVGDLILEPLNNNSCNFTESVIAYYEFKKRNKIPLFFGVGNVSELFDCDSNGVNGLLGAISSEVGANILFTPEASGKCKYSIKELKIASKMAYLSKIKKSLLKDLGYNLINYKDKKFDEITTFNNIDENKVITINATENKTQILDKGSFKIELDRENKLIVVIYFNNKKIPKIIIKGRTPKEIYETALRNNLITKMDHCAYFGKELQKAEIALKIGKKYNQDFDLFYNDFWNEKL